MTMLVCPLDFRYGRGEIKRIFSEKAKLDYLLKVEGALAKAHAKVGNIPEDAANEIARKASIEFVSIDRVKEIERQIKHDIMAVAKALSEVCEGEAKKFVHLGVTSYDIVDTANALQFKDGLAIIEKDLKKLRETLLRLAKRYKRAIMLGRTHGQQSIPITFGLKMAVYAVEIDRHIERLKEGKKRILVGKMMGAVGTGAALGEKALEIQRLVMEELGLKPEDVSTQIVGRDRYIELANLFSNISASVEKFATEIRNLQRSEIGEVSEAFDVEKQVGSSTMPHKRNPITCEQICSLARLIRSIANVAYENAIQWHERDLCNSANERFWIPHCFILTDWILSQMDRVFSTLVVHTDRMKRNIEASKGLPLAESVMMLLITKGLGREEAHEIVRKCSIEAEEKGLHLMEVLKKNSKVSKLVSIEELENALKPENYLGKALEIVDKVLKRFGIA